MASEEDELDRVMVQTWQAVAQSLRQTSTRIDNDLRMMRRERTSERMAKARQLDFDRRQLAAWKSSNHATLNRGSIPCSGRRSSTRRSSRIRLACRRPTWPGRGWWPTR